MFNECCGIESNCARGNREDKDAGSFSGQGHTGMLTPNGTSYSQNLGNAGCTSRGSHGVTPRGLASHPDDLGQPGAYAPPEAQRIHGTASSIKSQTIDEKADRSRATEIKRHTDRQWVAVTAYQPIDTITKTVEVPVIRTVEKYVPKIEVEKKIIEVPRYVEEYVDKIVEVPEVEIVDKVVEEVEYNYQYKYVPKVEIKENVIQRPKIEKKYIERIVYEPQIKEVIRYKPVETIEEVIKYVPKGEKLPEGFGESSEENAPGKMPSDNSDHPEGNSAAFSYDSTTPTSPAVPHQYGSPYASQFDQSAQPYIQSSSPIPQYSTDSRGSPYGAFSAPNGIPPPELQSPSIEQVFKPRVVKTVEIQKEVPVSVNVPVPYMVPKPLVVPIQVPVLKFRDHFIPVPVRRRVIPRIRWTNEVFEVECIKEKPFLQIQDVIKPVPCDVTINVHEFVEKAQPINPAELSQADIHAMWMRVNADLAEKKKEELGDKYPYVKFPSGTVFGEPGCSKEGGGKLNNSYSDSQGGDLVERQGSQGGPIKEDNENYNNESNNDKENVEEGTEFVKLQRGNSNDPETNNNTKQVDDGASYNEINPISLHPGHPLAMTYLQNNWVKKDTTSTHQMYTPEWFEAHQKALHGMTMQYPTQVQLTADQASQLYSNQQAFGEAPWLKTDENGLPYSNQTNFKETQDKCSCCDQITCSGCCYGAETNSDHACCGPC